MKKHTRLSARLKEGVVAASYRYLLLVVLLPLFVGCATEKSLPVISDSLGYIAIPMRSVSDIGDASFVYSYIINYSGKVEGREQIYPKTNERFALIGPLPPGEYSLTEMALYGGMQGLYAAASFGNEPVSLNFNVLVESGTLSILCCAIESTLSRRSILDTTFNQTTQWVTLDTQEVQSMYDETFANDPNFQRWSIKIIE